MSKSLLGKTVAGKKGSGKAAVPRGEIALQKERSVKSSGKIVGLLADTPGNDYPATGKGARIKHQGR